MKPEGLRTERNDQPQFGNLNDIYELKLQLGLIDPADRTDDYLDEEL